MPKNRRFKSNNRTRTRRRKGKTVTRLGDVDLPKIQQKPIQGRCLRYLGTSVTTQSTIAVADLRGMIGTTINATTTYVPLIDSVRLKRVGISAILSGTTGTGSVKFSWEGPNVPDIAETSFVGVSVPITRSYYPPDGTSTSWWYDNGATSVDLFSIQTASGDSGDVNVYLDIEFEYIIQDGAQTALTLTTNPGFTGIAYARLPLTQTIWVPLSLNAVTTV
jgi:hypothetical protein